MELPDLSDFLDSCCTRTFRGEAAQSHRATAFVGRRMVTGRGPPVSVPVKGLADPVEIYEVTGAGLAQTRLQAAAGRGLTRFVGRDTELEQLRRAQQLAGNSHGQIAAIVGEARVGKSRLGYELTHSHRLQG